MTLDFAISCPLVRPGRPRYPILVHRAASLLHASFRPHLAATPLRFANPSPPSGWVKDLHLQAVDHARHTTKRPPVLPEAFFFALDLSSFRRLQARRVEPFGQMRSGVGSSCPQQQLLALRAGWEFVGPFAISFGLNAKPLFQRDRLFESSSLHDALPSIRSGLKRYRHSHHR